MNTSMQLALVITAICLCLADAAPDSRMGRAKQNRPTRGFKNIEMMTARGFGKRARTERDVEHQSPTAERANRGTPTFKSPSVGIARDFGKRTSEWESEDVQPPRRFFPRERMMVATDFGKRAGNDDLNNGDVRPRMKFFPQGGLWVAPDYGKRNGNDDLNDEEEEIRETRGSFKPHSNILIARGYGKREQRENNGVYGLNNFWENLEASEKDGQDNNEDKTVESIPLDWFVNEMLNNPDFTRSVVRKFVDLNQDGMLSSDELLRNVV